MAALRVAVPERCRGDRGIMRVGRLGEGAVCRGCSAVLIARHDLRVWASIDGYHIAEFPGVEPDWDAIADAFPEMAQAEADAAEAEAEPTVVEVAPASQPEPTPKPWKAANAAFRESIAADPSTVPPSKVHRDREYRKRNAIRRAAYRAARTDGKTPDEARAVADAAGRRDTE
jgi:hypothetical protein